MPELQAFADPGDLQPFPLNALNNDVVTQVTVSADYIPLIACVAPIVAAEAPFEIEMADIVLIISPSNLHKGENI